MRMQRVNQLQRAFGEMQLVMHGVEHGDRQTLKQCHTGPQRIAELQLATHRAFGHLRDFLTGSGGLAQLINNLFVDERGVHIHHQQTGLSQRRYGIGGTAQSPNFAFGGLVNKMHIFLRHAFDSRKTLRQCPL